MTEHTCEYLIVGAGLAGASAVEGIRECDRRRAITMLGAEPHLPYDRPPLSKKLWLGQKKLRDIYLHSRAFFEDQGVALLTDRRAVALDVRHKTVHDASGRSYRFGKLLLATGATPQVLPIHGGRLDGICYYRELDDYRRIRAEAQADKSVAIVGGGFIGSEMAAVLCSNKLRVTMIYPASHLCDRVFPEKLGLAMEQRFRERGIRILKAQKPVAFARRGSRFIVRTDAGTRLEADLVIVGAGVAPAVALAMQAGLATGDGILVNAYLQTAHPDIYAAGDNARFPYRALGQTARVEHWDNALNQGRQAGRNMAGAQAPFTYMPYFFSDLFEFGYEAVGEVNARMETRADWRKPFETGTIYYLRNGKIRGAMMCNVWDQVETARALIRDGAAAPGRPARARRARPPADAPATQASALPPLAEQVCAPPASGDTPLTPAQARRLRREVPGWSLAGAMLTRELKFDSFGAAMAFVNQVARIADEQGHHPDMSVSYRTVRLSLTTHKIGGLSRNDFIMAARIDRNTLLTAPGV
ncbi:MAG: 4a-hydroxytetrahydrobiopterin dehydratase [Kiritimatiellae bacterium]|nr:4a-hydroxytetrahydrobiopterin dehydratase [Kiritimatiellia bacterium]